MKQRNTLTLILLLAALTLSAQSNYSPCYTNNMSKGNTAFNQGKYSEARTYYVNAKQCAGGNPTAAQQKINACDAKIKSQREAAEAKALEAKRRAEEDAKKKPQEFTVNGVTFKMIYVQGGTFTMGCTSERERDCEDDERPSHSVTVSDFYIGETEVTQALWKAVMGNNPSHFKRDDLPVEQVSRNDCQEFIWKLNEITGKNFRLPTEAEWEYAARGGKKSRGYKYAGGNTVGEVAWYTDNTHYNTTRPVKTRYSNELGIFDMSGNVYEWCNDWYSKDYYSISLSDNPQGPYSGSYYVFRGGSWYDNELACRISSRHYATPNYRGNNIGFRLVIVP